ncbi:metallophosphoesterase family protein [Aestuariispira insulae]|uniref:Calcineurin-like phosphoesterase family protein n=1 Tax=Aestuariispira insulae TaxID=1461337 RepID=A0A3D9HA24_9PROT|nr:metallophosphoesterase family protein [Aestuariispira insulae]RED45806.1 calcineurin-like phosphoesterase family protein [Aestuariispira insulae]
MARLKTEPHVPRYRGKSWIKPKLPRDVRDWTHGGEKSIALDGDSPEILAAVLDEFHKRRAWKWPKRRHYFFSDLHGDPDAFAASLVASGGVHKTGPGPTDFVLTPKGKKGAFVIGGDCFDKGPSSLGLLRTIHHLMKQGARVRVLAGNHDVRVFLGMGVVGQEKDPHNEHFFIRTGQKIIPLLKEVWEEYLADGKGLKGIPGRKECRRRLFPDDQWPEAFPKIAEGKVRKAQIHREIVRISKKMQKFEKACEEQELSLRQVYAAVEKWKQLFLDADGEFHWFFKRMRLAYKVGSLLFVHAGVDNEIARDLGRGGVREMNRAFKTALKEKPFDFYYGSLCNTVRTKYRQVDMPFSTKGARHVRKAGITAIIHGHRNLHHGQRISSRKSLISFECDATLDRHSRKKENVRGHGAAVTIIEPKGCILGISSDYPYVKKFDPRETLDHLKSIQPKQRRRV